MDKKYQGVMPPDYITNIFGPIGESIFSRPIYWSLSEDIQEKILLRVREKLTHLFPMINVHNSWIPRDF